MEPTIDSEEIKSKDDVYISYDIKLENVFCRPLNEG